MQSERQRLFDTLHAATFALTGLLILILPLAPYTALMPSLQQLLQITGLLAAGSAALVFALQHPLRGRVCFQILNSGMIFALAAYALALWASAAGAEAERDALLDGCRRLLPLIPFFVFTFTIPRETSQLRCIVRLLFSLLMTAAACAILYGLFQYLYIFPRMLENLNQHPQTVRNLLDVPGGQFDRFMGRAHARNLFGTFTLPNAYAGYLAAFIPLIIGLILDILKARGLSRARQLPRRTLLSMFILAGLLTIAAIDLILTASKGAGVALVCGLIAMWLMHRPRIWHRYRLLFLTGALLISVAGSTISFTSILPVGPLTSMEYRLGYWHGTFNVITHNPKHTLLGVGPGNFKQWYHHLKPAYARPVGAPHNSYLNIWVTCGLVGLVSFICGLFGFYRRVRQPSSPPEGKKSSVEKSDPLFERKMIFAYSATVSAAVIISTLRTGFSAENAPTLVFWTVVPPLVAAFNFRLLYRPKHSPQLMPRLPHTQRGILCGIVVFLVHFLVDIDWEVPGIAVSLPAFIIIFFGLRKEEHEPPSPPVRGNLQITRTVIGLVVAGVLITAGVFWVKPAYTSRRLAEDALMQLRKYKNLKAKQTQTAQQTSDLRRLKQLRRPLGQTLQRRIAERLENDPAAPELWSAAGKIQRTLWAETGEPRLWRAALNSHKQLAELRPNSSNPYYMIATLYRLRANKNEISSSFRTELFDKSFDYMKKAINFSPTSRHLHSEMASLLEEMGRGTDAQRYRRKAERLN